MRFAKIVFRGAAVWGILVLTPLYFQYSGGPGARDASFSYPQAYFGFLGVTLAFQLVFWVIGSAPGRFRPLMIPAMIEKLGYIIPATLLFARGQIVPRQAISALPDLVLLVLFIAAYLKTTSDSAPV